MSVKSNLIAFGGSNEDFWDDTELIKAYEDAVKFKEMLTTNGITDHIKVEESKPPGPWQAITEVATQESSGPTVLSSKNSESSLDSLQRKDVTAKKVMNWKVGYHCRAVYSEDGEEYEATITEVADDASSVVVRFIGYENEEEVETVNLIKSHGNKTRQRQKLAATGLMPQEDIYFSDTEQVPSLTSGMEKIQLNSPECVPSSFGNEARLTTSFDNSMYPTGHHPTGQYQNDLMINDPPPREAMSRSRTFPANPFPKMFMPPLPTALASAMERPESGKGELPSLLMAWYMSGYHSGYFDAKQDFKKKTRAKKAQGS